MGQENRVLVIADSRGRGLQPLIERELPDWEVTVIAWSGAGSELAAIKSLRKVAEISPELIIVMTGICDLTWRDRSSKITGLRHNTIGASVEHVMSAIRAAFEILEAAGKHRVSIATMTGIDLEDYNYRPRKGMTKKEYEMYCNNQKKGSNEQERLNGAIIEINRQITALGKKHGTPTTWTSTIVHSYYRGTHHHLYRKLADGCHPDEETKGKWAKQIIKSVRRLFKRDEEKAG